MKTVKKMIFLGIALMMLIEVPMNAVAFEQMSNEVEEEYHLLNRDDARADDGLHDDYIPDGWYDPEFGDLDTEPTEPTLPEEGGNDLSDGEQAEPAAIEIAPTNAQQTTVMHRTAVTVVNANFRRGPDTSYALISSVPANTNVRITGRRGNFYRIVHSGTTGWMHRNSLQTTRVTAIVVVINATVRTGPGASYGSFATLPSGTQVLVGDRRANWAEVTVNGRTGWIHTNSLAFGNGRRPGRARASVAVHTRPNEETNVLRRLPQGQEFMVLQRTTNGDGVHQGWTQIRVQHNGGTLTGWVRSELVEFAGQNRRTTGGGTHPVRTGPSSDFRLIQRIPNNTQVRVLAEAGNWSRIRYTLNGVTRYGWIANGRLTNTELRPQAPAGSRGPGAYGTSWGIIYGTAELRAGTGTNHTMLRTIPNRTVILIDRRSGAWLNVTYRGQTGWIHEDSIRIETTNTSTPTRGGTINANVALRRGAGTNYGSIRTLNSGANVTILRQSGDWLQIRVGNDEGYVREHYVDSTKAGVTNIRTNLRRGPGNNQSVIREVPSGVNVTIIRQQGIWYYVRVEGQTGWLDSFYVNLRGLAGLPNARNRVGTNTRTVNVSGEAGLRIVVPERRTIAAGHAFDFLEGIRVEHVNASGAVTSIPITWHQDSWSYRFTHNGTTFTVNFEGMLDNLTPGTYDREVVVRRGTTIVARANQRNVVR